MNCNYSVRPLLVGAATAGFTLLLGLSAEAQQVGITINGNGVDIFPEPITQAGRVFVPLRGVFEDLGASVVYSEGQINATGNGNEISLWLGSTNATVNGSPETIDVAPFMVGESTYVPLRFISQALGADVSWDEADQIVAISTDGGYQITAPPPPIPAYDLPPYSDPNDRWVPGYWAWSSEGYYWVPGTWMAAPEPGFLWTPGYWSARGGQFGWHPGYWGRHVGFYGGVDYGGGYFGHGYAGDRVINNNAVTNISYNGGPGGIATRPTVGELSAARGPHLGMTSQQRQHAQVASRDRRFLASVNSGQPPIAAVAHPFTPTRKPHGFAPVLPQDRVSAQQFMTHRAPMQHPVMHHAMAPMQHPVMHHAMAPMQHPVMHHAMAPVQYPVTHHAEPPVYHPVAHHAVPPVYHPVVHHAVPPVYHPVAHHAVPPVHHPVAHHPAAPEHHPDVHHTPKPE